MELHLYEWVTGPGIDSALISSAIPPGKSICVETANPRLILLQEGDFAFTVTTDGGKHTMTVRPGDTLIIPGYSTYWYCPLDSQSECRLGAFRIRFFNTAVELPAIEEGIIPAFLDIFGKFKHLEKSVTPRIQYLIDQYRDESEAGRIGRSEMLQCVSTAIFIEVLRQTEPYDAEKNAAPIKNRVIVRDAQRFLAENLSRAFSLDDVGWNLGLSGEHVARIFKKETGTTVFQYLKELRIAKAAEMLAKTDQKVHEIAGAVGFSSHSLFSRVFRDALGISPEAFRTQRREAILFEEIRVEGSGAPEPPRSKRRRRKGRTT